MDLALFVAYPYRSLIDFARARQRDGVQAELDKMTEQERENAYLQWAEENRSAWENAYNQWTSIYGRSRLESSGGGTVVLENDEQGLEDLRELAEKDGMTFEEKVNWQDRYRKMTSYPYWKRHCDIEKRETMMQARYQIAEGRRLFREVQDFESAKIYLEQGMANMQAVIDEYDAEDGYNAFLADEDETIEEAIKALLIWQRVLELLGEPIPEEYPLKRVWTSTDGRIQMLREDLTEKFLLWQGG
jgi:hypothetical protein